MPYDVQRLNAIHQAEAEISDRDAVVEVVAGLVETMVRGHPKPTPALEDRYRTQLRVVCELMRRLAVGAALPQSLRRWCASHPTNVPAFIIRGSAEETFEPLLSGLDALDERDDGERAYYGDVRVLDEPVENDTSVTDPATSHLASTVYGRTRFDLHQLLAWRQGARTGVVRRAQGARTRRLDRRAGTAGWRLAD